MGEAAGGGVVRQLRPGDAQERPEDVLPLRRDARQPPGAGAPQEVQQHGLGAIVGVVGGQDGGAALLQRRPL